MVSLFFFGGANGVMDVAMNAHGGHGGGQAWASGHVVTPRHVEPRRPDRCRLGGNHADVDVASRAGVSDGRPRRCGGLCRPRLFPVLFDRPRNVGTTIALPNKATLGIGILCFLGMVSEGAVLDWGALHLRGSLDVGPGVAATGFAAFSASMAASRFSGDWLRGRMGSIALVRWSAEPRGCRDHRRADLALAALSPLSASRGRPRPRQSRAGVLRSGRTHSGPVARRCDRRVRHDRLCRLSRRSAGHRLRRRRDEFDTGARPNLSRLRGDCSCCQHRGASAKGGAGRRNLGALIDVVVAHDIVLAEIIAELDLDHLDIGCAKILQPMTSPAAMSTDCPRVMTLTRLADGDRRLALDDGPMLAPELVALQREPACGITTIRFTLKPAPSSST